jgi:site-specific recombinase XerD
VTTALLQIDQVTIADASRVLLDEIQNSSTRAMYGKALSDFLAWCQTQSVSTLTRIIVEQHKDFLLSRGYSAATINQRLTAIRQYTRHTANRGLLAKEDAAEILAVRGIRKKTILSEGQSLDVQEAESLLNAPNPDTKKGKRDRALLAILLGCGLKRNEIVQSKVEDIRRMGGRWVLSQVVGGHGRVRTVPLPSWVKRALDRWLKASKIRSGVIFRALNRDGTLRDRGLSAPMVLVTVAKYGKHIGVRIAPRDLRLTCARLCRESGADLEQIQLLLGHANIQATGACLAVAQDLTKAPNDALGMRWRGVRKRAR